MKRLVDSTLREGEQAVGVIFRAADRLKIFTALAKSGVEEIEIGIAATRNVWLGAMMPRYRNILSSLAAPPRVALWCRCRPDDISFAASLEPDVLSLSVPASDLHRRVRLGISRKAVLRLLEDSIMQALSLCSWIISVGFEDASRAEPDFLAELATIAARAGASRIRLADTVGILSPGRTQELVHLAKKNFIGEIGVHTHNDFGMASANAIAALEAGADWVDVTILGLGERAGNARYEEVASYLALNGLRPQADLVAITKLAELVANISGRSIETNRPIIGKDIFACESGLHVAAIQEDPATYEPFAPERVGAGRHLLIGAKAGKKAIAHRLAELGVAPSDQSLDSFVQRIRSLAAGRHTPLNDGELRQLATDG